jgi:hypothetical protein
MTTKTTDDDLPGRSRNKNTSHQSEQLQLNSDRSANVPSHACRSGVGKLLVSIFAKDHHQVS